MPYRKEKDALLWWLSSLFGFVLHSYAYFSNTLCFRALDDVSARYSMQFVTIPIEVMAMPQQVATINDKCHGFFVAVVGCVRIQSLPILI